MSYIYSDLLSTIGGKGSGYKSFEQKQFDDYIKQMEDITGRKLTQAQIDELRNVLVNNEYSVISRSQLDSSRAEFNRLKSKLISDWEINTKQQWPVYAEDVVNAEGKITRYAGQPYDAHHIIELSNGGDNAWWNMHPAGFPYEHQAGIHGAGSIANEIFRKKGE